MKRSTRAAIALAKFVGVQVYEQAGGAVRRDLFADEQNGIFLTDAALLESLTKDRLVPVAEQVQAEGWGWVDVAPRATYADLHQFQRMRSKWHEPSKAEAKRIAKLEAQQGKLQDRLDDKNEDMTDEQAQVEHEEMDILGSELDAIERALVVYPPARNDNGGGRGITRPHGCRDRASWAASRGTGQGPSAAGTRRARRG